MGEFLPPRRSAEHRFFEDIFQDMHLRSDMPGLAIDSLQTQIPEDAIFAQKNPDGSFDFAVSLVEAGLLDREGKTLHMLAGSLRRGDRANVCVPPTRRSFHFGYEFEMPALTITGSFRPDRGLYNYDLLRTKVHPQRIDVASPRITDIEPYRDCLELASIVRRYDLHAANEQPIQPFKRRRTLKASGVVETFANIANIGLAGLADEARIPFVFRNFKHSPEAYQAPYYSYMHEGHDGFKEYPYGRSTSPVRDIKNWVNHVVLTHYFEHGKPPLSNGDMRAITEWFNNAENERGSE